MKHSIQITMLIICGLNSSIGCGKPANKQPETPKERISKGLESPDPAVREAAATEAGKEFGSPNP